MGESSKLYIMRADANSEIGSGHMMRCLSIAEEIAACGCDVLFLVSDDESTIMPADRGFNTTILSAGCARWGENDGLALGKVASKANAGGILVDSYAVTDSFFSGLRSASKGITVGYVDDLYTFEHGLMAVPTQRDVGIVFNYGFYQCENEYLEVYANSTTRLCLGLEYAPIRSGFARGSFVVNKEIRRILITTGSTNPNHSLERMAACALRVIPNVAIDIVVGAMAEYGAVEVASVALHKGVQDLSPLMHKADLAISAAGTALYELCAVGLPTIAVPIVENQLPNVNGFASRQLGLVCPIGNFDSALEENLQAITSTVSLRSSLNRHMRESVNGAGSLRIAEELVAGCSR